MADPIYPDDYLPLARAAQPLLAGIVDKLRAERALFGEDKTHLTEKQKKDFVEVVKSVLMNMPIDTKANEALIDLLNDYFNVPKNKITIRKGLRNKNKVVEISG